MLYLTPTHCHRKWELSTPFLGIPVTSAEFMATMTEEHIHTIFKSSTEGEIPLVKERLKAINDAGKVCENFLPLVIFIKTYYSLCFKKRYRF